MKRVSLEKIRDALKKYLENQNIYKHVNIHYTTELEKVKANVQADNEINILISGNLSFGRIFEAVAHEVAHLFYQNHGKEFKEKKNEIKNYLRKEVLKKCVD